jgi:hypothetical protein
VFLHPFSLRERAGSPLYFLENLITENILLMPIPLNPPAIKPTFKFDDAVWLPQPRMEVFNGALLAFDEALRQNCNPR